ncbi:MAG: curli-like amyloid fiber formation chaperone CsgH [Moheibacter sp.]
MKTYKFKIFFLLIFIYSISFGQDESENTIVAKIEVEQNENMLSLHPSVQNNSSLYYEYNYLLLVKKTDRRNNLSVNRQGGKFTLAPNESKVLSTTIINQSETQTIQATLYIRDEIENQLITKDSIEIKGFVATKVEETSLMTEGMVVDETKTKFGGDFFDNFYSIYSQLPEKHKFIISISELPYRGLTSIIQIKAEQETVYEFFSNPNEDYIKQQAVIALKGVSRYAKSKENLKQEFNY